MKKNILLFLCLITSLSWASGQHRITGKVIDTDKNEPIPFASVLVKGTIAGVNTDDAGNYIIDVSANAKTLVFSSVTHATTEVDINGRTIIDVSLKSSVEALDEVIVIGYGTRKIGTVVGSVAQISSSTIKDKPIANISDALQGKVAGLQIYTSSGEPSQTSSMRIHGVGSLSSGTTPLYILDGAPVSASAVMALNSNDFESITILKDASATAIYGSRASNGVIIYTTKRGTMGQEAIVSITGQYGWSSLANTRFYDDLMNAKQLSDFWVETGIRSQAAVDKLLTDYPNDFVWGDYMWGKNKPVYQADISIRGGGNKTSYYLSAGYFDQEGAAPRSSYAKYNVRSNIEAQANKWMKVGTNIGLTYDESETNAWMGNNYYGGNFYRRALPFYTPYDKDGKEADVIPGLNAYNPYYLAKTQPSKGTNARINGTAFIQLTPMEGLTIRSQYGLTGYDWRNRSVRLPSYKGSLNNGQVSEYFARAVTHNITNTAEYKFKMFEEHEIVVLLGQEGVKYSQSRFDARSSGQTDDRLTLLQHGPNDRLVNFGDPTTTTYAAEYAYLSFFGRLSYAYNDKIFVDLTTRNDQSSRFGANNRSAWFYSAGAMWDLKKESFLTNINWISSLQARASIGTQGNSDIGNYNHLALIGSTGTPYDGDLGWYVSNPGNPELTWEKQTKFTAGFGINFFKKINLDFEYYLRSTSSMLLNVPYPYTSGFGQVMSNVGTLKNSGVDITLGVDIIKTKDWYLNFNTVFNYNRDKITELFDGYQRWDMTSRGYSWVVGQPVSYYYPIFAGIDSKDGKQMWYVPGEDPTKTTKDPNNVTKVFSEVGLLQNTGKSRYPPVTGGFGISARWKGFSVEANFSYVLGKYLINNDRYFTENPQNAQAGTNQSYRVLDYWKEEGDISSFPKFGEVLRFDSHLLENASFLRLKSLTIGYSMPKKLLQKTKLIKNARFYVTGRNLFTVTDYLGQDPEQDNNVSIGIYPNTRQITLGINITL